MSVDDDKLQAKLREISERLNALSYLFDDLSARVSQLEGPPYGTYVPVVPVHIRDGDTVVVRVEGTGLQWPIRLRGVDCPERGQDGYDEAKAFVSNVLHDAAEVSLFIPIPESRNILASLSFDRIPADIYVDGRSLADLLRERGLTTDDDVPE